MASVISRLSGKFSDVPKYATGSYGVTHTDEGMLRYFWEAGCRSMLDVGCGPGGQANLAKQMGYRSFGIEVDPTFYRHRNIALIDCCVDPFVLPSPADLVWTNEVAEHIPPHCVRNYLITLTKNAKEFICMTANQEYGPLHISVHPCEWWIEKMAAMGWDIHSNSDDIILSHSTMAREFMKDTGMIFVNSQRNNE